MTEKAIVITTDNEISIRDLEVKNDSMLEALQQIVGGYIETVRPIRLRGDLLMIVNEEGLLQNLPVNEVGSYLYGIDLHGNPIVGNIAIVDRGYRNGEPDLVGLSPMLAEEILRKFMYTFPILKGATQDDQKPQ